MKKHTLNNLLIRYNKYRKKIIRLHQEGRNVNRQKVLKRHLERIYKQLSSTVYGIHRQTTLAASFAAIMSLGSQAVAQTEFKENHINQFGLEPFTESYIYATLCKVDMDNDGDLDIISGHYDGDFRYFQNTGSATAPNYAAPVLNPFSLVSPGGYTVVASADMDNDGDIDILANQYGNGDSFKYYENIGTATSPNFAAPVSSPFGLPAALYSGSMQLVDVDGDTDFDLMSTNGSGVRYFENVGTISSPSFAAEVTNPFGITFAPYMIRFEDLDNDGDLDILGATTAFLYMENTGSSTAPNYPSFTYAPFSLQTNFGAISGIEILDMDGDNDYDVVYNHYETGNFHYFENVGTQSAPKFSDGHRNLFSLEIPASAYPSFGDLDNDGDLDMISEDNGSFYYYQNTGDAANPDFASPLTNPFGLLSYVGYSPSLVDIDGDNDLDIMTTDGVNFNFIENTGTATAPAFAIPQNSPFSIPDTYSDILPTFTDIDDDGDFDILAEIGIYGDVFFYENIGSATNPNFGTTVVTNPFSLGVNSARKQPAMGDLDNDGDLDLFFGHRSLSPGFTYYENTGTAASPVFGAPVVNPFSLREVAWAGNNPFRSFPTLIDLDDDGDLDLMAGVDYRGVSYFENISACSVNSTVNLTANVLTANQNGAQSYQWVDCNNGNTPIPGATSQTFTPTANGSYACQITLPNCNGITDCATVSTIGLSEAQQAGIVVYPNPATTMIHIESEFPIESILIFNVNGSCVGRFTENEINVNTLSNGIYYLSIKTTEGTLQSRFVKQ